MSKIKQALPEDIDVTSEGLVRWSDGDKLAVMDYPTFAKEYDPYGDRTAGDYADLGEVTDGE